MSDQSDHLDPKEATEAKLCAYLEGELPASERAEIEQHLTANPQHRKLLADLAQTREWMRAIPRESAPSDLAESFQGQVERTMLLGDAGDSGSGLSMARWPQYVMLAAIVVLVLGLGVTLVVILKGPTQTHDLSLLSQPASTQPAASALKAEDKPTVLAAAAPPAPVVAPVASVAAVPAPTVAAVAAPGAVADEISADHAMARRMVGGAQPTAINETDADQIKTRLAGSGYRIPSDAKTICFVVQSDSPAVTGDQVHGFFTRHQLMLEEPASLALAPAKQLAAAFDGEIQKQSPNTDTGQAQAGQNNQQFSQNSAAASSNNASSKAAQPENEPAGQNRAGGGGGAGGFGANNSAPGNLQQQNVATAGATTNASSPALADRTVESSMSETLYVAHGLTPLQLELLDASLAADNPNQPVKRLTLSQGAAVANEAAAVAGAIGKGQTLTVTIPQLVGPGIEKTNIVKVSDDGNISLPMIDPLPAAGTTATELEQRIATKYREANLIPDAAVNVAAAPATQPATMPTTQPMAAVSTTTQPSDALAATTQPAHDQGIDVVVVVEKTASK